MKNFFCCKIFPNPIIWRVFFWVFYYVRYMQNSDRVKYVFAWLYNANNSRYMLLASLMFINKQILYLYSQIDLKIQIYLKSPAFTTGWYGSTNWPRSTTGVIQARSTITGQGLAQGRADRQERGWGFTSWTIIEILFRRYANCIAWDIFKNEATVEFLFYGLSLHRAYPLQRQLLVNQT